MAFNASFARATSSADRNFAIGERHEPSPSTTAQASPFAPNDCAFSVSASKRLLGNSPVAFMARITGALLKTLNSDERKMSVTSTISTPIRRSGRSEP